MADREPSPGELADRLNRLNRVQADDFSRVQDRLNGLAAVYVLREVADERQRRVEDQLRDIREDLGKISKDMRSGQETVVAAIAAKELKRQQIMLVVLGAILAAGGSVFVLLLQAGLVK